MHDPDPAFMHPFRSYDEIRNFPLDEGDVLIQGYPKSGTNWMQVILANLWDDWSMLAGELKQVPHLTGRSDRPNYCGYSACLAFGTPRLMKTHLPVDLFPRRWPRYGKVVHVIRNPKDTVVSFYHQVQGGLSQTHPESPFALPENATLHDFVLRFVAGTVPYGLYTTNAIGWHNVEHPNLLKISYEQAKMDALGTVRTIAQFVGKPVSEERIRKVVAMTDFDAIKSSDLRHQINLPTLREGSDDPVPYLRKGIVGGWKDSLSVADSELLDETVVAELERNGLHLIYEPEGLSVKSGTS